MKMCFRKTQCKGTIVRNTLCNSFSIGKAKKVYQARSLEFSVQQNAKLIKGRKNDDGSSWYVRMFGFYFNLFDRV